MGTDIHVVFQKQVQPSDDVPMDPRTNGWVDIEHKYDEDRDYNLFAVLANVRNGFGFAGVYRGEPVNPITHARGFPEDFIVDNISRYEDEDEERDPDAPPENHPSKVKYMSPWRQSYANQELKDNPERDVRIWMGYHDHTWASADELMEWFLEPNFMRSGGYITREEFEAWDRKSPPESYCGDVNGPGVRKIDWLGGPGTPRGDWNYIRVYWTEDLNKSLAYFFDEVERLQKLHAPCPVRIVMGFDS